MSIFDRFKLTGKRLFITGGSRGLGREMALAIADAGADVILVGRDPGQSGDDGQRHPHPGTAGVDHRGGRRPTDRMRRGVQVGSRSTRPD